MQGGNFYQAFVSAAMGSLAASGWSNIPGKFSNSTVGMISFAAVSGGIGSSLVGGNFWEGFVIGSVVAGLNDGLHEALEQDNPGKGKNLTGNNSVNDSKQYKQLSEGEIRKLKKSGWSHDEKGRGGGKRDLYKDKKGNIYEKPKGGNGSAEPINKNINDLTVKPNLGSNIIKIFDKAISNFSPVVSSIFMTTPAFIVDMQTNRFMHQQANNVN